MGGEPSFREMLDSVFRVPPVYDDSYYGFRIHKASCTMSSATVAAWAGLSPKTSL